MARTGQFRCLDFSPKTVLAINGAVALASEDNGHDVEASELAQRTAAPLREVRAVATLLRKAGLVQSNGRGMASLSWGRDPARVSLYDIAAAVGERFEVSQSCNHHRRSAVPRDRYPLDAFLMDLRSEVIDLFKARKLNELVPPKA